MARPGHEQLFRKLITRVHLYGAPTIITDMKTRHLYIQLAVQDGEREHTHHCLHESNCKSPLFAVMWYASHYWGEGELERHDNNFHWWFDGEITVQIEDYKELTSHEANLLNKLFYYPHNT